jgi:hypothetical protein
MFLADGLLKGGVDADAVIAAVESLASGHGRLQKYDPNQPRVAAGSGRTSGQWTSDGASSASNTPTRSTGVPRTGSNRTRLARPLAEHPSSSLPAGPINPLSITPVAGGHKATSDTGRIAMNDCIKNIIQDALLYGYGRDWAREKTDDCIATAQQYYEAEYYVEMEPSIPGGFARFPDGGLIIMRKGRDDIYVPRGYPRPRLR